MPKASTTVADKPAKTTNLDTLAFATQAARCLHDDKCTDVVLLSVGEISSVADYIVIGTGTSDRQMKSVLDHVGELGDQTGNRPLRTSADERTTWLLADFGNVIVHLFEPNARAFYDLEMLWGDAPRLDWARPASASRKKPAP